MITYPLPVQLDCASHNSFIYIYILRCADKTYYTGITNNITRRIKEHSTGKSKSTKKRLPVSLIHLELAYSYKEAAMIERKIKNAGAKKCLIKRVNYNII